jgi:Zn-dependent protease
MKWSWKIARVAGIDVYIHATFLLILSWVALGHWSQGLAGMLGGVLFILALFACVVLHEFGHALTARPTVLVAAGLACVRVAPRRQSGTA